MESSSPEFRLNEEEDILGKKRKHSAWTTNAVDKTNESLFDCFNRISSDGEVCYGIGSFDVRDIPPVINVINQI